MLTTFTITYTAAVVLCLGALAAGVLAAWAHFRLRTGAEFVTLGSHREELVALRQRYRRRLRALRDATNRHKAQEEDLRSALRVAADHNATQTKLITAAHAEIATLRERIGQVHEALGEREREVAAARVSEAALATALDEARARVAAFEHDHGLLRIERDELAARTERLRALPVPGEEERTAGGEPGAPATPRAEIADRNARIHELECQLRESGQRMAELQSSLNTWKYRIAPIALHMQQQRERAGRARAPDPIPAATGRDDLKRIQGIGRGIEKKLNAEGITRFEQIAAMGPAELANLAVRLGVAASRPQRDGWASQAGALLAPAAPRDPAARDEPLPVP